MARGKAVSFLDETEGFCPRAPAAQPRPGRRVPECGHRCARLDGCRRPARILVIASQQPHDAVDAALVAPGQTADHWWRWRCGRRRAARDPRAAQDAHGAHGQATPLFEARRLPQGWLTMMGGNDGADITRILSRALAEKVHQAPRAVRASLVSTQDIWRPSKRYKALRSRGREDPIRPVPVDRHHANPRALRRGPDCMKSSTTRNYLIHTRGGARRVPAPAGPGESGRRPGKSPFCRGWSEAVGATTSRRSSTIAPGARPEIAERKRASSASANELCERPTASAWQRLDPARVRGPANVQDDRRPTWLAAIMPVRFDAIASAY